MANAAVLRLLPVPSNEPPYDDKVIVPPRRSSRSSGQAQAALPLTFTQEQAPATRSSRTARRQVSAATRRIAEDLADLKQWRRTSRADLCDPQPWAMRLSRGIAEVIIGARSPRQLSAWFTDDALEVLVRLAKRQRIQDTVALRLTSSSSAESAGPHALRHASTDRPTRVLVRSVHTSEPSDGVCEVSVHLRIGQRSRAVAMRAEGRNGRWICTALQIG